MRNSTETATRTAISKGDHNNGNERGNAATTTLTITAMGKCNKVNV